MNIIFDHDAEGMTELEALNYVPQEGDVIGNVSAAMIAMDRFKAILHFKGLEFSVYERFENAFMNDMNERGINLP